MSKFLYEENKLVSIQCIDQGTSMARFLLIYKLTDETFVSTDNSD